MKNDAYGKRHYQLSTGNKGKGGVESIDSENMFNAYRFCRLLFMTHSLRVVDCNFLFLILKQPTP